MSSSEAYQGALATVADYVDRIGDEVVDQIDTTNEEGDQIDGYQCLHGTTPYVILASPDSELMIIQFDAPIHNPLIPQVLQADPEIAADLEGQEEVEVEVTPQHHQQAQQLLSSRLSGVDEGMLQDVRQKLTEILAGSACAWEIRPNDQPIVLEFSVKKNIFPQSDDLTIGRFDESVQTVITQGVAGHTFVQSAYGLQGQQEDQEQSSTSSEDIDPSGPGSRGFR